MAKVIVANHPNELKEADRYAVIQQVIERTMGQADAALWLNISVHLVKRLARSIQIVGSPHAWFEQRAARCCLIAFIDDATGTLLQACFSPAESTDANLHSLQCYVGAHRRPLALYSDRHSIFTKHDPRTPPRPSSSVLAPSSMSNRFWPTPHRPKGRLNASFRPCRIAWC